MAKRLQRGASIAVPRRIRSRVDSTAVTSLFKRVVPATGGPYTEETPTLPRVPIDIEATHSAAPAAGRAGPTATVPCRPVALTSGSKRVTHSLDETPTLQLTPLEVGAIAQAGAACMAEPDASAFRTVESIRLALGSSSIRPTTVPPAANARGPRRARQTLRAEKIKSQPVTTDRPSRKR
jgi:hypothetical protein